MTNTRVLLQCLSHGQSTVDSREHATLLIVATNELALTSFFTTIMPFPFSFRFSVPGMVNPFQPTCDSDSASVVSRYNNYDNHDKMGSTSTQTQKPDVPSRRRPSLSPAPNPPKPLTRKRGWVPSDSEPSLAAAKVVSTSGYLDAPAKYRDMALSNEADEMDAMVAGE